MNRRPYVLVTPAKNEAACIQRTIEAVLSQTVLPKKWLIVSDGSVDQTDEIVSRYAGKHSFIELLRAGQNGRKDFGSKVKAFHAGYAQLGDQPYDFLGNLDADVTFKGTYYEQMLEKFDSDPQLGVAAGIILELVKKRFLPQNISLNSAAGAVQFFRKECYDSFGGYVPIRSGGIDAAAEIMARMHGWKVRTFPEIPVYHHRRVTTGGKTILNSRFRQGTTNYLLGYHPFFQLMLCLRRVLDQPYVIGSVCALSGYGWSWFRRSPHVLPDEVVKFLRSEQIARIASPFSSQKVTGEK